MKQTLKSATQQSLIAAILLGYKKIRKHSIILFIKISMGPATAHYSALFLLRRTLVLPNAGQQKAQ